MLIIILAAVLCPVLCVVDQHYAMKYLHRFGYANENDLTKLEDYLLSFQKRYNIPATGELDENTIQLLNRPRCNVSEAASDDDHSFRVKSKWSKFDLKWYFPQATPEYLKVTKKAFEVWNNSSKFKFELIHKIRPYAPDISITVVRGKHYFRANCQGRGECSSTFDGPGKVLAHAYFPKGNSCIELHIDADEKWDLSLDGSSSEDQTSLLMVLIHEIGHILRIAHSVIETAIMYPWYQFNIAPKLDEDDKMALEALYGPINTYVNNPFKPTSALPPTTKTLAHQPNESDKNLCVIIPEYMFIAMAGEFENYHLYIINENSLWKIDLNSKLIPSQREILDDYLPEEVGPIIQIFQSSSDNLIAVNDRKYYVADFPALQIFEENNLIIPKNSQINTMFQSNHGKIYVFYNSNYIEFDKNLKTVRNRGQIKDIFPGLPTDVTGAFQYIDGHMYFFKNTTYYKYNEFTKKLVAAEPFNWNVFDIPCPNGDLLNHLKILLTKIISFYQ
ncbi:matrix metalloproteinase-16-like [Diorhabda sublineata]|uniref:matrix metalloproteinase-16-like n=1 Tax=Diorhabda sublineata TaxID=1163346 RepID=UPI0024E0FC48|nr:matrix metalloproteinase-16-like [Diorhabda sublineata]